MENESLMKTPLIISILIVALNLMPNISFADNDDNQYPAANFQPKVLYIDRDFIKVNSTETNCASKSVGEKSVYDPKYPAANFEPRVIYP